MCVCLSLSLSLAATSGSFVHCVLVVWVYVWVWPRVGYGASGVLSLIIRHEGALLVVCVCLSLALSLASNPGSFIHCVLVVRVYAWVWPGVGHGVSGEFRSYYSTRGWRRLKTRSPFDTSSPEHSTFDTHVSISFRFPTGLSRYFVLESDEFLWPDVGLFFLRRWIWTRLLLFGFVDINRHYATQSRGRSRSRTVTHEWGAFCDRNLPHWISEKGPGRGWDSRRKSYLCPKICVTNLQFDQVRFFFTAPRFPFFCCFVATQLSIRNAHKWFEGKPGSARFEDTPAMDLELKSIRIHM